MARDLATVGLARPIDIVRTFMCGEDELRRWAGDGPSNTDDLPYTQYTTRFSGGPPCTPASLAEHLETAWPYVTNVDERDDAEDPAKWSLQLLSRRRPMRSRQW